jgi:hypothetical protein
MSDIDSDCLYSPLRLHRSSVDIETFFRSHDVLIWRPGYMTPHYTQVVLSRSKSVAGSAKSTRSSLIPCCVCEAGVSRDRIYSI